MHQIILRCVCITMKILLIVPQGLLTSLALLPPGVRTVCIVLVYAPCTLYWCTLPSTLNWCTYQVPCTGTRTKCLVLTFQQ